MKNTICYIVIYIIEAFIFWQYCNNIFDCKRKKIIEIITYILAYSALFFISLKSNSGLNLFSFAVINFIAIYFLYNLKWYNAILHSAILTIIMSASELIVYTFILHNEKNFINELSYLRSIIILTIFSKLIYFTISYIISKIIKKKQLCQSKIDLGMALLIFIPLISISIFITLFSISMKTSLSVVQDWMILANAAMILAVNMIVFHYFDYSQRKNYYYTEMQIQLQKEKDISEYYKLFSEQNNNQNILIHDIKNHLNSILKLSKQNDSQKIEDYILSLSDLISPSSLIHASDIKLLNAIICRYQKLCSEYNINFKTDIRTNTVNFLSDEEITSLFTNLMDNAIEASKDTSDAFIDLNITKKENTDFVIIKMINSCKIVPEKTSKGILVSHKTDKHRHGWGMKSIENTVKKYNGQVNTHFDPDMKYFYTTIIMNQSMN